MNVFRSQPHQPAGFYFLLMFIHTMGIICVKCTYGMQLVHIWWTMCKLLSEPCNGPYPHCTPRGSFLKRPPHFFHSVRMALKLISKWRLLLPSAVKDFESTLLNTKHIMPHLQLFPHYQYVQTQLTQITWARAESTNKRSFLCGSSQI